MKLLARQRAAAPGTPAKYRGVRMVLDGSEAAAMMEAAASDAVAAPAASIAVLKLGQDLSRIVNEGRVNANGRQIVLIQGETADAAAVAMGASVTGLRAAGVAAGSTLPGMHGSLFTAAGRRLPFVLHVAAEAVAKHAMTAGAGHDGYHAAGDTGCFQLFAKDVQEAADLTLIAHRIAELSLTPGICAQDACLTTHALETLALPERDLVREFLGDPAGTIDSPTPAQRLVFGGSRRRIPEFFDLDYPVMLGQVHTRGSYAQAIAAQRRFYADYLPELADQAFAEFAALSGRTYARASKYRLDDAEYVIAAQGSVVPQAEAIADYLRASRNLRMGVLNVSMWRPFPADLVTRLLAGKKAVTVLERADDPLAPDRPLLRDIRAAMSAAVQAGRPPAGPGRHEDQIAVPAFYSGCFGCGGDDARPEDLVAAVENMMPSGGHRRRFYLGVQFVRRTSGLPKVQIWQERLTDSYPDISALALPASDAAGHYAGQGAAFRIHSRAGWHPDAAGGSLARLCAEVFGSHVRAIAGRDSDGSGLLETYSGVVSPQRISFGARPAQIDVVLAPDPGVFRHADVVSGLADGGAIVVETAAAPGDLWNALPAFTQRQILDRNARLFCLNLPAAVDDGAGHRVRSPDVSAGGLIGAFLALTPLREWTDLTEGALFERIEQHVDSDIPGGTPAAEVSLSAIRHGYRELRPLDTTTLTVATLDPQPVPPIPEPLKVRATPSGFGQPGRFWEQVGYLSTLGLDGLADPFAALGAAPALSGSIADLTNTRTTVPRFSPENCTGCGECWMQCPQSAIPGLVTTIEDVLETAMAAASESGAVDRVKQLTKHLARECRTLLAAERGAAFDSIVTAAYSRLVSKLGWDAGRRAEVDAQFDRVREVLAALPLARTEPFFDAPESRQAGTGGLLTIAIDPDTCDGCGLCIEVCADRALVPIEQDGAVVQELRRRRELWNRLPDTPDRFVAAPDPKSPAASLSTLLLKKATYVSRIGGHNDCAGCGERTVVHLLLSAIHAAMQPRVTAFVGRLDALITGLDARGRELLAAGADVEHAVRIDEDHVDVPLSSANRERLQRIGTLLSRLKDLRWRYVEGPGGRGRAALGVASASGSASLNGTYPCNPYPFPWTNHALHEVPSVAIGMFEGHMRRMAEAFACVRRAEIELAQREDAETFERELAGFDWRRFTSEELLLCPPLVVLGSADSASGRDMESVMRLFASGKPLRVVSIGSHPEASRLGLLALADGRAFVHQSSQASAGQLMAGVLRGIQSPGPALFNLYAPCPSRHGLAPAAAFKAAHVALASRAFPTFTFDPDAGATWADGLTLEGNPSLDRLWPTRALAYETDGRTTATMETPLTTADWAATEGRFSSSFREAPATEHGDRLVALHEYLELDGSSRSATQPFIYAVDGNRLRRLIVAPDIVRLTEDRQRVWSRLRQLAGVEIAPAVRARILSSLEGEYQARAAALREDYESRLGDLKATYAQVVARRLAEGLMHAAEGRTVEDLVASALAAPYTPLRALDLFPATGIAAAGSAAASSSTPEVAPPAQPVVPQERPAAAPPAPAAAVAAAEPLVMEPYIDSALCTSCNECTNLNNALFAYNRDKQAYIKDPRGGTFQQLVKAAELCPVKIIHPGTPLDPLEKDLDTWIARAAPFN